MQSLPEGWAAAGTCAQASAERSFYGPLSLGLADAGLLAKDPEARWAQGSDEGTWRRDLSPCGGLVNFEFALPEPPWIAWASNPSGCPSPETSCKGDWSGSCPMGLSCGYDAPYGTSSAVQSCGVSCRTYEVR